MTSTVNPDDNDLTNVGWNNPFANLDGSTVTNSGSITERNSNSNRRNVTGSSWPDSSQRSDPLSNAFGYLHYRKSVDGQNDSPPGGNDDADTAAASTLESANHQRALTTYPRSIDLLPTVNSVDCIGNRRQGLQTNATTSAAGIGRGACSDRWPTVACRSDNTKFSIVSPSPRYAPVSPEMSCSGCSDTQSASDDGSGAGMMPTSDEGDVRLHRPIVFGVGALGGRTASDLSSTSEAVHETRPTAINDVNRNFNYRKQNNGVNSVANVNEGSLLQKPPWPDKNEDRDFVQCSSSSLSSTSHSEIAKRKCHDERCTAALNEQTSGSVRMSHPVVEFVGDDIDKSNEDAPDEQYDINTSVNRYSSSLSCPNLLLDYVPEDYWSTSDATMTTAADDDAPAVGMAVASKMLVDDGRCLATTPNNCDYCSAREGNVAIIDGHCPDCNYWMNGDDIRLSAERGVFVRNRCANTGGGDRRCSEAGACRWCGDVGQTAADKGHLVGQGVIPSCYGRLLPAQRRMTYGTMNQAPDVIIGDSSYADCNDDDADARVSPGGTLILHASAGTCSLQSSYGYYQTSEDHVGDECNGGSSGGRQSKPMDRGKDTASRLHAGLMAGVCKPIIATRHHKVCSISMY